MRLTIAITAALAASLAVASAGLAAPGIGLAGTGATTDDHQGCNINIVIGPVSVQGFVVGLDQQVVCIDTCELLVGTYNALMGQELECPH